MEQAFREKIMPTQWFWCILNNLDKFDNKPKLMLDLIDKFKRVEDHRGGNPCGPYRIQL